MHSGSDIQRQILIAVRADDSPFKKVDLKNAFANYALHFSLSALAISSTVVSAIFFHNSADMKQS